MNIYKYVFGSGSCPRLMLIQQIGNLGIRLILTARPILLARLISDYPTGHITELEEYFLYLLPLHRLFPLSSGLSSWRLPLLPLRFSLRMSAYTTHIDTDFYCSGWWLCYPIDAHTIVWVLR